MSYPVAQVHQITNNRGEVGLSKCASRKLLNIRSRVTFIRHCRALGYEGIEYFYPEHLKQLLAIALFTRLGGSRHSREQFIKYQRAKLLDRKFKQRNINLEEQTRKLEHDYAKAIRNGTRRRQPTQRPSAT